MLKKLLFGISALLLSGAPTLAQERTCATMSHMEKLEQQYPGTKAQLNRLNQEIARTQNQAAGSNLRSGAALLTIPVVVHVIYNNAAQNISQAQIQSQIDVLNEDFNRLNADSVNTPPPFKSLAANTDIQFELAKRDPNGDPTTGVTRTNTAVIAFRDNDDMKFTSRGGHDAWDRNRYLNIWVCRLSGGILGYAQFPGSGPANTDGVVINTNSFGRTGTAVAPFHKGRTATHEVGHWLSLYHIWGDEPACAKDDLVADTPLQKGENSGCKTFPLLTGYGASCATTGPGAMFMNYMDYSDDVCMNLFTTGQKNRMHAAIQASRPGLDTSDGLTPVVVQPLDAAVFKINQPAGFSCLTSIAPEVVIKNRGAATLTTVTITYGLNGGTTQTYQWTGSLATFATTTISLPALAVNPGNHTFTVATSQPNGQADNDPTNDSQTVSFTTAAQTPGLALPYTESFEAAAFPPAGWQLSNPDNDFTWEQTSQVAIHGTRAAWINNYDYYYIGEQDELILPPLDLSTASAPQLTFQVAYSPVTFGSPGDTLEVLASTDCGVTFSSLFKKSAASLSTTASNTFTPFTPTSAQWRLETINLANLSPNISVILKFRNTTGYENNLYLDDVRVSGALGTKPEISHSNLKIYPNPGTGHFNFQTEGLTEAATLTVTNALGQQIWQLTVTHGTKAIELDLSDQAAGLYLVQLKTATQTLTRKLIIAQ